MSSKTPFVTICIALVVCFGCKKDDNEQSTQPSSEQNATGFMLDYENSDHPQVLKSKLLLRFITIRRHHVNEPPIRYDSNDISKIVLCYALYPERKDWWLEKIDLHLKDGGIKSELSFKGWDVELEVETGDGASPVSIEQHFVKKQ